MRNRKEEIKRRIAKRKKQKSMQGNIYSDSVEPSFRPNYYDSTDFARQSTSEFYENNRRFHPLFNKEVFAFKVLASAILVLLVAILFQNQSPKLEPAKAAVVNVMEKEFQFAAVTVWYENTFGKPLALFPEQLKSNEPATEHQYALPANAKILEDFDSTSQGVTIQTLKDADVEAVNGGTVTFAGKTHEFGYTIIVQHPDSSETWYGNLSEIYVNDYDRVDAGAKLGKVSTNPTDDTGEFYFAVKMDEQFIDPVQVIKFE